MQTIKINAEIFSNSVVVQAISDFESIVTITAYKDRDYYSCSFSDCVYDEVETVKEFENYLIDLMASQL